MSAQLLVWAVQIMSWTAISCSYKNCWSLSGLESVFPSGTRIFDGNYMYKGCHNGKAYYGASSGWYLYWSAQTTNWHITKSMNEETAKAYCPENSLLLCSSNNAWRTYDGNGWIDAPTARNVVCATQHPSYYPTIHPSIYPTMDPSNNPTNNPSRNPTVYPTNNPSITPTNHPTTAPTFVPTELPSYSPIQHPTTDPSTFLSTASITNDDYGSTLITTQLVTHNRRSASEATMGLGAQVAVVIGLVILCVLLCVAVRSVLVYLGIIVKNEQMICGDDPEISMNDTNGTGSQTDKGVQSNVFNVANVMKGSVKITRSQEVETDNVVIMPPQSVQNNTEIANKIDSEQDSEDASDSEDLYVEGNHDTTQGNPDISQ